jgi:hypothetical protein
MEITLDSGIKIDCDATEAIRILKEMETNKELKGYYFSKSKNKLVKISDMNDTHLRNTILKLTISHYENMKSTKNKIDNSDFILEFSGLMDDATIKDLLLEAENRFNV